MNLPELYANIDNEIDTAAEFYKEDPKELRRFAHRIGVPEAMLPKKDSVEKCATASKVFLKEMMYARLTNLRQYGHEIELSLCFSYDKTKDKFVISQPEKLAKFIQENPNYCQFDKHHFRGKSHGNSRSFLYHVFHNKFRTGAKLEKLLQNETRKVLGSPKPLGVDQFLANDFKSITPTNERAKNFITRLMVIQKILQFEGEFNNNPYKDKIKELIQYLLMYSTNTSIAESRRQHLVQVCDDAYVTIQHVFDDLDQNNKPSFAAKIKIFEALSELHNNSSLMNTYHGIINSTPPLHDSPVESIEKRFDDPIKTLLRADFSIENSAFTKAVKAAADGLITLVTNVKDPEYVEKIERQRQSLRGTAIELTELVPELKSIADKIDSVQAKPLSADDAARANTQVYYTTTQTLKITPDKPIEEQVREILHYDENEASRPHTMASSPQSTLGDVADEQNAVLLENPENTTGAGAVMLNEDGLTKIIDFEDLCISFANLLAEQLLKYTHSKEPISQDALRIYIKEKYIDMLQSKSPP